MMITVLSRYVRRLTTAAALAGLIAGLAAACGSAQPAATPAPSYLDTFQPMLGSAVQVGTARYATVLGTVTGSGTQTFSVPVRRGYALFFACLGSGGFVSVKSPALDLDTRLPCTRSGRLTGWEWDLPPAAAGKTAVLRASAPAHARWEFGLYAAPR
jgi:hypothetical protein